MDGWLVGRVGAVRVVRLCGGTTAVFLVDDVDYEAEVVGHRWYLHTKGYVYRKGGRPRRNVFLHRQLLGLSTGDRRMGEHISRDPLDNRRANLRIAERGDADNKQNLSLYANNTSGYRGVTRRGGRWVAQCMVGYCYHYLGMYDSAEAAGSAAANFRAEHMPFSEEARCRP